MGIDFTELNVASAILAKAGIADYGTTDTTEQTGTDANTETAEQSGTAANAETAEQSGTAANTETAERTGTTVSQAVSAPLSLSPLTLAYIGDCVYELIVRTIVVGTAERTVNTMHKHTCRYVNAAMQREMLEHISVQLTETEQSVVRRGRNAKSHSVAKHASVSDYRHATGFEALCGYWYLSGQNDRMLTLITEAIRACGAADATE